MKLPMATLVLVVFMSGCQQDAVNLGTANNCGFSVEYRQLVDSSRSWRPIAEGARVYIVTEAVSDVYPLAVRLDDESQPVQFEFEAVELSAPLEPPTSGETYEIEIVLEGSICDDVLASGS